MNQTPDNSPAFDPRIQTENIAYRPNELVECGGCGHANPPNRPDCLYCARALDVATDAGPQASPSFRKLEPWEHGFNVVLTGAAPTADPARTAALLGIETPVAEAILTTGARLPVARVETEADASFLKAKLQELTHRTIAVSDLDLDPERPPVRLSGLELGENHLRLENFNTREMIELRYDEITLIVTGSLFRSQVESLEKKRRGGKSTLIRESATAYDEGCLDLYSRSDAIGFRVHVAGFDFSCLGEKKTMLAAENIRELARVLQRRCANVNVVDDYDTLRSLLSEVWPPESRKDSRGLLRTGFGKTEFGSVISTSNLAQFTKYSRLQWHLL